MSRTQKEKEKEQKRQPWVSVWLKDNRTLVEKLMSVVFIILAAGGVVFLALYWVQMCTDQDDSCDTKSLVYRFHIFNFVVHAATFAFITYWLKRLKKSYENDSTTKCDDA